MEGSLDVIYKTMKMTGLQHDEGPDVGGEYGPYVQSERMGLYMDYAKELVEKGMECDLAEIERDTDRDNFMTAQQACDYGLVDKVMVKHGEQ